MNIPMVFMEDCPTFDLDKDLVVAHFSPMRRTTDQRQQMPPRKEK